MEGLYLLSQKVFSVLPTMNGERGVLFQVWLNVDDNFISAIGWIKTLRVIRASLINESFYWNQREVWFPVKFYAKMWTRWVEMEYFFFPFFFFFFFFFSFDEILFWEDESGGYSFDWKYIDVFGLVEIVFEMRGKKLGTLRIDFKVSIEVLDDALCSTYEEIFDIIGIFFLSHCEFLSKISKWRLYFRVRIEFQSFHYLFLILFLLESFRSEDLGISKISQWMKLNIFRNGYFKKKYLKEKRRKM